MAGSTTRRQFGNIRKLPSGRWQARFTSPTGAKVAAPRTFAYKIDAEAWLADRRREIDRGLYDPHAVNRRKAVLFADYASTWLANRQVAGRPIKVRTREHYGDLLAGICCQCSARCR